VFGYSSGKRSGEILGNMLGYGSCSESGEATGNMLGYGSGSDSGEVSGSDSGMELVTISRKNPDKCSGKKLGKELPGRVKTRVRRSGKKETCKARGLLCFRQETFLYTGTSCLYETDSTRR
jgi:hypothetical protein